MIHFKLEFDITLETNGREETFKVIGNIVDELREKLQRMDDVEAITTLTFENQKRAFRLLKLFKCCFFHFSNSPF